MGNGPERVPFNERKHDAGASLEKEILPLLGGRGVLGIESVPPEPDLPNVIFTAIVAESDMYDDEENKQKIYDHTISVVNGFLDVTVPPGRKTSYFDYRIEKRPLPKGTFYGVTQDALSYGKKIYNREQEQKEALLKPQFEALNKALDGDYIAELETIAANDEKEKANANNETVQEVIHQEYLQWLTKEVLEQYGYDEAGLSKDEFAEQQELIRKQLERAQHQWEKTIDEKTAGFLDKYDEPLTEKDLHIAREQAEDYILNIVSKITGSLVTEVKEIGPAYFEAILIDPFEVANELEKKMKKDRSFDMRDAVSDIYAGTIASMDEYDERNEMFEQKTFDDQVTYLTKVFLDTIDEEITDENIAEYRDEIAEEQLDIQNSLENLRKQLVEAYLSGNDNPTDKQIRKAVKTARKDMVAMIKLLTDQDVTDLAEMTTAYHFTAIVDEEGLQARLLLLYGNADALETEAQMQAYEQQGIPVFDARDIIGSDMPEMMREQEDTHVEPPNNDDPEIKYNQ